MYGHLQVHPAQNPSPIVDSLASPAKVPPLAASAVFAVGVEPASVPLGRFDEFSCGLHALISVFLTGPVRRFVLAHPLNDRVL
jgi:hypothetical protein